MAEPEVALSADELIGLLQRRWQVSYDLRLLQRQGRLYFQVMWGHLEQQSFPLTPQAYREKVAQVAATLNALGAANQVRTWLEEGRDRPRMGKALSLALLVSDPRAVEFLLCGIGPQGESEALASHPPDWLKATRATPRP